MDTDQEHFVMSYRGSLPPVRSWVSGDCTSGRGLELAASLVALTATTLIGGCSTDQPSVIALTTTSPTTTADNADVINGQDEVDWQSWKSELVALPGVLANPDMATLYTLTVDDCNAPIDQLALELTMAGANQDATRIGFKYVCPHRISHVDQAVAKDQQTKDEFAVICGTPPGQRTDDQKLLIEAAGPQACASG